MITETDEFKVIILLFDSDFIWHTHELEDKLFLVVDWELFIDFQDGCRIPDDNILLSRQPLLHARAVLQGMIDDFIATRQPAAKGAKP